MNIIKVDFWMERVISWNNWKVPDLICINSICSMLYAKLSTDLRWALTKGHPVWKGGIFGASLLSLGRIIKDRKEFNKPRRIYNLRTLYKTGWTLRFYDYLIFYIKNSDSSWIQVHCHLHSLTKQIQFTITWRFFFKYNYICAWIPPRTVGSALSDWFLVQISKTTFFYAQGAIEVNMTLDEWLAGAQRREQGISVSEKSESWQRFSPSQNLWGSLVRLKAKTPLDVLNYCTTTWKGASCIRKRCPWRLPNHSVIINQSEAKVTYSSTSRHKNSKTAAEKLLHLFLQLWYGWLNLMRCSYPGWNTFSVLLLRHQKHALLGKQTNFLQ